MAYDGRAVANFVLDHCDAVGRCLTNLGLQKTVYFCHVWSLIDLGAPLVKHRFEAWEYGPVLPYLWREFRTFERTPIRSRARRIDPYTGQHVVVPYEFGRMTAALLQRTVSFYARLKPGDLVDLSHVEGGPWHEVWHHGGSANPGMRIEDEKIVEFYRSVRAPFTRQ